MELRTTSDRKLMRISESRIKTLIIVACLPLLGLLSMVGFVKAADVPPILDLNGDATGVDYSAVFTEDGGPEPIVNATGLTIVNGEDNVLTSARAVLTNILNGNLETLSADPGATGLDVVYSAATGELSIKGNASVESYQTVLRTLVYDNGSQSPDPTDRVILVTVSDGPQTSVPAMSTVAINAVNDAPVLDNTGNMMLASINEDDYQSNGNSIATIIKSAEQEGQDRITDVDKNSLEGFAVIEAISTNGLWQYSLDAGKVWTSFDMVSNTSATLLDGNARIRFVPNANFHGSVNFLFRAWDQSGGRASGTTGVDASVNGGTTSFSEASGVVSISVLPVNDLPVVDMNGAAPDRNFSTNFFEAGPAVPIADPAATVTDVDNLSLQSMTITLTNRPDGASESLTATELGSIKVTPYDPATGRFILTGPDSLANFQQILRQVKYQNISENPATITRTVTVIANDGLIDSLPAITEIKVNKVNSAPVLDGAAVIEMAAIPEDTLQPIGEPIAQILSSAGNPITDADIGALEGIAIIAAGNVHGQWQYNLDNPPVGEAGWLPVGTVSETAAVLLYDTAWLRFVPSKDYFGGSDSLSFRAWDRTIGSNGQRDADVSVVGGSSPFSTATNDITIDISPVNDLPLISGLPVEPLLYVEDAGSLALTGSSMTLVDADSDLLTSATIRLTNPRDGDAEWLFVTTEGTKINAVYEGGVIELTGVDTVTAYQQVLRSLKYLNTSQDPDETDRVITLSVADSEGSRPPGSIVVRVQGINDPPDIDLNGVVSGYDYATNFPINRGAIPIVADSMAVSDVDNTTLKSATVRISNLKDSKREILSVDVSGTNISDNFKLDSGVLELTGTDSIANYQKVIRSITYENTLPTPNQETRIIQFELSDGLTISQIRTTSVVFIKAPDVHLFMPIVSLIQSRGEEPNDTCAEAPAIQTNVENSFHPDDRNDWFYFDLQQESTLTVELSEFTPGKGQILVAVEKEAGLRCGGLNLLGNNGSDLPDKTVSLGRRAPGRYYIWIINDGVFDASSFYKLYIRAVP